MKVYINGRLVPKAQAKISIFDHGLLYGDGVFEGIRVYDGLIFKLEEHIDRLCESAHTLMLRIGMTKAELIQAVIRTLQANKLRNAYIRLIVTRGEGDLGLDPRKCTTPTVLIIADGITLYPKKLYERGLELVTVPTQRNVPEAINPQIKSLNYLNNVLAKIEANTAGYQEAVMLNTQGYVTECTGENLFIVRANALLTPPPHVGILRGITRDAVMELGRNQQLHVEESVLTRHDLYNADECLLTGTAAEVVPVVQVDGRVIGTGRPGPVTRRLIEAFRDLTHVAGIRYQERGPAKRSTRRRA